MHGINPSVRKGVTASNSRRAFATLLGFQVLTPGRPDWADLSDVTTGRREKSGNWPGQILQISAAGLAASITSRATDSSALVGSNKPYAAMMHFGGDKSDFPHLWGDIPGRPYLPMDTECVLQPEAEEAILELALIHLEKAARL
ncbi:MULTISPECIES: phage virion morphogenesis protein [unclassified Pseudomonas]|uniref:phage virion morphogenesis protein n=1 Tax=unclassified Pseudomonas TaxID=196821 RepID=UPI002AC90264|nr:MULTISPECIES: phage virion morphogenesis protein [unclassified Pseudomonas]MEB0047807.1 phage virion morphogenesis protein [Pseudomonas sp. Dout3]MEB0098321.1 phage virion morphogenesis protein [Pseudomonas sp. DC1.2]WPX57109.1 phage virion morphogenesis protein [Pseudomonas sp. DC1.2]